MLILVYVANQPSWFLLHILTFRHCHFDLCRTHNSRKWSGESVEVGVKAALCSRAQPHEELLAPHGNKLVGAVVHSCTRQNISSVHWVQAFSVTQLFSTTRLVSL